MKSGWMSWVRTAAAGLALAAGVWSQGAGAAEVRNVEAKYAWPWGVYINYEVVGTIATDVPLYLKAVDKTKNVTHYSATNMLSGDTGRAAGKHQVVWDLDKQGISLQSTNVTFTVAYELPLYCVIDLSSGANASSYPVTYLHEPPSGGFNTDAYKTTKLVLRRIEPGTFKMGGSIQTTLSKPYYVGLFEVTQKQYELVTGSKPSKFSGEKRPVEKVSWDMIRGNTNWPASSAVSASSFMGRLRARTGLGDFDLPTEAQWEFACGAGTTTTYSYGDSANGDYMWYSSNSSNQTHEVGTKKANAWGLYDMHGNVCEWCLDWYGALSGGTDPKGSSSGSNRVDRGGSWHDTAYSCTSSHRDYYDPSYVPNYYGFRLVRTLSE